MSRPQNPYTNGCSVLEISFFPHLLHGKISREDLKVKMKNEKKTTKKRQGGKRFTKLTNSFFD